MKRIEGLVDSSSFEVDPVSLWQETISGKSLSIEIGFSEVQNWDLVKGKKESYFTRMRTKDSSRKSNSRGNSLEDLEVSYLHLTLSTMKAVRAFLFHSHPLIKIAKWETVFTSACPRALLSDFATSIKTPHSDLGSRAGDGFSGDNN